jgi:hypothetical protein
MNPFLAFCLYVAARVFVQYLKFRPKDHQMLSSLKFLLDAMQALKRKNPLTESFLAQLDVDLEGAGIDVGQRNNNFYKKPPIVCPDLNRVSSGLAKTNDNLLQFEIPQNTDSVKCTPLFEIRDSQTANADINAYNKLQNSQPSRPTDSPGPPFQVAKGVNFDMDTNSFDYLSFNPNNSYQLPARGKLPPEPGSGPHIMTISDSLTPPSDMDKNSPIMTINDSNSRSNSIPNSFSPPSLVTPPSDVDTHQAQHHLSPNTSTRSKPSPMTISSAHTPGVIPTTTTVDFMSTLSMDPDFNNLSFQPNFMNLDDAATTPQFTMQSGWEMSGIETTPGTGLTPSASGEMGWSQILEGIQDWGLVGVEQQQQRQQQQQQQQEGFDAIGRRLS